MAVLEMISRKKKRIDSQKTSFFMTVLKTYIVNKTVRNPKKNFVMIYSCQLNLVSATRTMCIKSSKISIKEHKRCQSTSMARNVAKISSVSPLQFLQCSAVIRK